MRNCAPAKSGIWTHAPVAPVLVGLLMVGRSAIGAPVPDRPTRSRSAQLVESGSLEAELGAGWTENGGTVPLRVKGSTGKVEPRVTVDLGTVGVGAPGLSTGAKLALVQDRTIQLAGQVRSDIPLDGDIWTGEAGGLLSLRKNGLELRADVALALEGGGGIRSAGVPVSGLVGWGASSRWAGFVDAGVTFYGGGTATAPLIMGGARWLPTDRLQGDLALGWDAELGGPVAALGAVANFGRLRR